MREAWRFERKRNVWQNCPPPTTKVDLCGYDTKRVRIDNLDSNNDKIKNPANSIVVI